MDKQRPIILGIVIGIFYIITLLVITLLLWKVLKEKMSAETLSGQRPKCGPVETRETDADGVSDDDCNV